MTDLVTHPAASHEFLSRLHDGELSPAEEASFRSHRDGCAECREAVDSFERTLAAYRAAPTGAPSSDLSARILRKVRAQSPSRRPFGVTFGIDIRWAGAMVAAILIVLVAAPILLRKEVPTASAPIPISLASRAETEAPAKTLAIDERAPETVPPAAARAPAAPPASRQILADSSEEKDAAKKSEASDRFAAAPSMAGRVVAQESPAQDARAREDAPEDKEARRDAIAAASGPAPPPHLSIRALDEQGQPPQVASRIPEDRLESLRGQAFEILVGPDGAILEATSPVPPGNALQKQKKATVAPGLQALRGLRFASGETSRRLLVVVE